MSPSAVNSAQNGENLHLTDTAVAKNLAKANMELINDDIAVKKSSNGTSSAGLDASRLTVHRSENLQTLDLDNLDVNACTDHMVTAQWTLKSGWQDPKLIPFGPISLMPNASVLQ